MEDRKLYAIRDLEGVVSPHDSSLKRGLDQRKEFFRGFRDIAGLARHIGGEVESLGLGESWAIRKQIFPGVEIHFIYDEADEEFPCRLRALFSGDNIRDMKGEDMYDAAIFVVNYMAAYVRKARA
ncbi:MAG: DUF3786 domain-containing protein [Dehalococcoidia bacterium]|nr:DUF3786 domain-containing protein [Dehalococcoidia bacterium]